MNRVLGSECVCWEEILKGDMTWSGKGLLCIGSERKLEGKSHTKETSCLYIDQLLITLMHLLP